MRRRRVEGNAEQPPVSVSSGRRRGARAWLVWRERERDGLFVGSLPPTGRKRKEQTKEVATNNLEAGILARKWARFRAQRRPYGPLLCRRAQAVTPASAGPCKRWASRVARSRPNRLPRHGPAGGVVFLARARPPAVQVRARLCFCLYGRVTSRPHRWTAATVLHAPDGSELRLKREQLCRNGQSG